MDADGYVVGGGGWCRVASVRAGSIRIDSSDKVHAPPAGTEWRVAGRAGGTSIALFRMSPSGKFAGHGDVTLRDFLAGNPRYLVGQAIRHEGTLWRVVSAGGGDVRLEDDAGRTLDAGASTVVDENLSELTARVVLLVDVG